MARLTMLSLAFVGLVLSSKSSAQGNVSLPISATIAEGYTARDTVKVRPDRDTCRQFFSDHYAELHRGEHVVVYELTKKCARISPPNADFEAWLERRGIRFEPDLLPDTSYLAPLEPQYREYVATVTPTACAVALEEREIQREAGLKMVARPGTLLFVYRTTPQALQISRLHERGAIGWLPRSTVQVAPLFPHEGATTRFKGSPPKELCLREIRSRERREYQFTTSNAFYAGPSAQLEITDLFEEGATVREREEFANGWRRTRAGWFAPEHARLLEGASPPKRREIAEVPAPEPSLPELQFPAAGATTTSQLRLRSSPSTGGDILFVFEQ